MGEAFKTAALVLVTEKCYKEYFDNANFLDGDCFKSTLSRGLGIGLIAGSFLVKLPQILKIVKSKSGKGISILSVLLDLFAITATVSYSYVNGFPFSSWGDGVSLALQTVAIAALVLHYDGATQQAIAFIFGYLAIAYALMSGLTPMSILWSMQASIVPILLTSKFIQAWTNFKNGNTGQLSAITCAMLFFGSTARIFTSIQETGDSIMILTYVCAASANAFIIGQVFYYWNAAIPTTTPKKSKKIN